MVTNAPSVCLRIKSIYIQALAQTQCESLISIVSTVHMIPSVKTHVAPDSEPTLFEHGQHGPLWVFFNHLTI